MNNLRRHPSWLKVPIPSGESYKKVEGLISKNNLTLFALRQNVPIELSVLANVLQHS